MVLTFIKCVAVVVLVEDPVLGLRPKFYNLQLFFLSLDIGLFLSLSPDKSTHKFFFLLALPLEFCVLCAIGLHLFYLCSCSLFI